jgi:hypothetical protein
VTQDQTLWKIPSVPRTIVKFDRYAALQQGWEFSTKFVRELTDSCRTRFSENVLTVGLAGSFGRFEGSVESDADYIMIVNDPQHASVDSDRAELQAAIKSFGISPPNKTGVFSQARSRDELLETIGREDEEFDQFGKRMLLLLESRPIYRAEVFADLTNAIFDKYTEYVSLDGDKEFTFLANDLMRYFRYICVNYQANFWRQNERWALRNLKLRHSRIIMYAGLLFLLGEASKYTGAAKISAVRDRLDLTPLERLAWVYESNGDRSFYRVLGLYNVFVARAGDSEWRKKLQVDYENRYSVPQFAEMKSNSDALVAELVRFVFARRGQWSDRFFEYLFF